MQHHSGQHMQGSYKELTIELVIDFVCEQSAISDPEIKQLCARIIESQQAEIEQMQAILKRY